MTQPGNGYPREIVSSERASEGSQVYRVVTIVANQSEEKAVRAAMAYMDAFNAADVDGEAANLNYPHARVGANGALAIRAADDPGRGDLFDVFRSRTGWSHSCWDSRVVIQSTVLTVQVGRKQDRRLPFHLGADQPGRPLGNQDALKFRPMIA